MYWGKGCRNYVEGTLAHFEYSLTANFVPGKRDKNFNFPFPTLPFEGPWFKTGLVGTG